MKKSLKSKALSVLLSLAIIVTMIPGTAIVAYGDEGTDSNVSAGQTVTVSTASELAALGGAEIAGTVELAADIDMSGVTMEPIAVLSGTFDGKGHTISNLSVAGEYTGSQWDYSSFAGVGLTAVLDGGMVKNLNLDNVSVSTTSKYNIRLGAIAGSAKGASTVQNCSVNGTISCAAGSISSCYAGGIIGYTEDTTTIVDCASKGSISNAYYAGGIIGYASGTATEISGCASSIDITSATHGGGVIGIIGINPGVSLKNSFANGSIEVKSSGGYAGGLFCSSSSPYTIELTNCFFDGSLEGGTKGSIACWASKYGTKNITITNCYYTSNAQQISGDTLYLTQTGNATSVDAEGLKTADLGDGFAIGEDGYPVPAWMVQTTGDLIIIAEGAESITLVKDGAEVPITKSEDGAFTAVGLEPGEYTCTAVPAAGSEEYEVTTKTIDVVSGSQTVTITMERKLPNTVFTVEPAGASLSVYAGTAAEGTALEPASSGNGTWSYALKAGSYAYAAEAEGYQTETGTIIVPVNDSHVTITLSPLPKYAVAFQVSCGDAAPTVTVKKDGALVEADGETGVYSLYDGEYSYEVTADGYMPKTGTFTVSGADAIVDVTLETISGSGSEQTPYLIGTKEELKYFAEQVNDGNKAFSTAYVKLTGDIDLEGEPWTPLGKNRVYSFKGHFDGQGHTISGINVEETNSYYGFFGCLENATVENLTVSGQVYCSEPYGRVGGLAGYAVGDVTIRNCASLVNVSALARGCEGVGGLVGGYEDGVEYKWEDHSLAIESSYNAGTIVCTGTDANTTIGGLVGGNKNCVQLKDCYNIGTVYGPGVQAAGLLGNAGYQTGDNSYPSMSGCFNAGQVTGAEGKEFGLYGKGTISESRMENTFALEGTAAGQNKGSQILDPSSDEDMQKLAAALGDGWMVDPNKNNGLPYLNGVKPVVPANTLLAEAEKYKDVVIVAAGSNVGTALQLLKEGQTASDAVTLTCSQLGDDIQRGYLNCSGSTITLKQANDAGTAITETVTLQFSDGTTSLRKPVTVTIYPSAEVLGQLMDNIAATYVDSSDEWVVFDMAAYEKLKADAASKTSDEAKENYLNLTINALAKDSAMATDRAKAEIILNALQIDSTRLTTYEGQTFNNGAKLQAMNLGTSHYTAPWVLLADELGNVNLTDAQVKSMVNLLLQNQGDDGLFHYSWAGVQYDDVDTTGSALAALARFYFDKEDAYGVKEDVAKFVEKAVSGLRNAQGSNGSYGNVNSDAFVIIGLAAIGQDPARFTKDGCSLMDGLYLYVNDGNNGFTTSYSSGSNGEEARKLATEQGFRALITLEKMKTLTNSAFNIYTNQVTAVDTGAVTPGDGGEDPNKEPGTSTGPGTTTPGGSTTPGGEEQKNIVVSFTVKPSSDVEWLAVGSKTYAAGTTVYDVFVKELSAAGMSWVGAEKNYVQSITWQGVTLAAFDKGPNSGWLYTVNGSMPSVGIKDYTLKDGDRILFYYTENYTTEPGTGSWAPVTEEGPTVTLTDETGAVTKAGGKAVYDSKTGVLTITPAEGYEIKDVLVNGVSKGAVTELKGLTKNDKVTVIFAKSAEEDPGTIDTAKIIKGVEATTIKLRTVDAKKGYIKVGWTKSKGYKVDGYEVFRSVKRYSGYTKKPFFTKETSSLKATYKNNKALKSGVRYYYKVRGYREIDGQKYYTQWSNKAWWIAK